MAMVDLPIREVNLLNHASRRIDVQVTERPTARQWIWLFHC